MDANLLARLMLQIAKRDMLQGTGRILIPDVLAELNQPNVTGEEMIDAFKTHYPQYSIERPTKNVIRIDFDPSLKVLAKTVALATLKDMPEGLER